MTLFNWKIGIIRPYIDHVPYLEQRADKAEAKVKRLREAMELYAKETNYNRQGVLEVNFGAGIFSKTEEPLQESPSRHRGGKLMIIIKNRYGISVELSKKSGWLEIAESIEYTEKNTLQHSKANGVNLKSYGRVRVTGEPVNEIMRALFELKVKADRNSMNWTIEPCEEQEYLDWLTT